jgi:hypothetical protein
VTRALVLAGGWDGHDPEAVARWAAGSVLSGFDVTVTDDLRALDPSTLGTFDLLCPLWTYGELSPDQEAALLGAAADGLGLLAWHGATSAFLGSRPYKHLLGGQFVAHPGGAQVAHTIRFRPDPLTVDLPDVSLRSEQYYLLVDPAVRVLATTEVVAPDEPWLAGTEMPAAWVRRWGEGRVAYVSVGHGIEELALPPITELLRRLAAWAAGGQPA